MADEFVMPKLGLTMESGTIVTWLVDDGAEVQSGQPVLVIETDKVESEVEATRAGLFQRLGDVGQEYPCGAHIGWYLEPGEQPPAAVAAGAAGAGAAAAPGPAAVATSAVAAVAAGAAAPATIPTGSAVAATGEGGRLLASPNARRLAGERGVDLWSISGTGPGGRITSEDVPLQPPSGPGSSNGASAAVGAVAPGAAIPGALATAAARRLADLLGVDVTTVGRRGTDPRVTREDVAAHVRELLGSLAPTGAPSAATGPTTTVAPTSTATPTSTVTAADLAPPLQTPTSVVPLAGMRGTIAKRMSQSLHSMAQLTLTMDVDMDAVVADRSARKAAAAGGPVPGYTDYVIAATAAALVEHPGVNSQIIDAGVALLPQVNIGMAVALADGLIVPVVHDTPGLSLEALAAETSRLAAAARDGKLQLPELEGGTFSVTALGMFDVDGFTPIINAPNSAILGVGRLRDDVAWSDDDRPIKATRLTLSLTWDHQAFDGAPAAEFTRTIKQKLEAVGR